MTEAQLRAAIDLALAETPFEPPVTTTYCEAVRDALRASLPAGTLTEVYFRRPAVGPDVLVVSLWAADQSSHTREIEIPVE